MSQLYRNKWVCGHEYAINAEVRFLPVYMKCRACGESKKVVDNEKIVAPELHEEAQGTPHVA